ncbi:Mitochondrial glycoprotein [Neofusicoccum parvum]|uniref:Mitochondrial glycoprotein n=1 Tax=Neofusicoccum parvum TaxID=310453 RepID=A0ACB5RNC0_9PEZI|nr:Mitochondrial glycoprotein [Neofusicoccum parvum]GME34255.1 Mitochondrial glycoprotein [Neofusicoccum parvum]
MLSFRSIARSAPRSFARLSTKAARPALFKPATVQAAWRTASAPRLASAFHTSVPRYEVQDALVAKLESELNLEDDVGEPENYSDNIKDYLENSPFEIKDVAGQEEVVLTRKYNNENIRVTFTIADINEPKFGDEEMDDPALYDEGADMDAQSGGANTKGSVNQGRTPGGNIKVAPEDKVSPADRPELEDEEFTEEEEEQSSFPVRAVVTITKDGQKGALSIDAVAQDSAFQITNVHYFPDGEQAEPKTAEKDWARRNTYPGPLFGQLDEDLQILLEEYLEERGIDTRMALFIPDYIDYKEQKEYLKWLENLKGFVSA